MEKIRQNIERVKEKVENAKIRAGRNDDVTIIAVTKTVPPQRINEAIEAGILDIGENRVQELLSKYESISKNAKIHLIGHLQRNKFKYILGKTALIHSVDSERLLEHIDNLSKNNGIVTDILLQLNISGEESKYGLTTAQLDYIINKIERYENIRVRGLMTIAPFYEDKEKTRPVFQQMYEIFCNLKEKNVKNVKMEYLSMGMSNDFEVAVEEGSNMIRIGTAIFGSR